MSLILSVTSSGNNTEQEVLEHEFSESGGTIGRRVSNAWILPDENRHLSGSHATVEYDKGSYFIVDTSTNGVFINGSSTPLGRGKRLELEDGFQLMMGTFNIHVAIKNESKDKDEVSPPPISDSIEAGAGGDGLFADLVDEPDDGLDPLPVNEIPSMEAESVPSVAVGSEDPFFEFGEFTSEDDLNKESSFKESNVEESIPDLGSFFKPAEIKTKSETIDEAKIPEMTGNIIPESDPFQEEKKKEKSASVIPDDWDTGSSEGDAFDDLFAGIDDPFSEPEDPFALTEINDFSEVKAPALEEREPKAAVPPPRKQPVVLQEEVVPKEKPSSIGVADFKAESSTIPSDAASAFMKGLGVDEKIFGDSFSEKELFLAGKLFRVAIKGTMEVLQSRSEIKNEMRMDMTTIQPIQNNPIKFAVNTDEALKKLFIQKNQSYMKPEQAMDEAFDDIKSHQIAVISGIQASLVSVLKRFEPENLIKRLEKESPISANIPIHRKAKLWDKFELLYDSIESEAEDDFNRLFGQEFAKAYDEQVALLEKQRGES